MPDLAHTLECLLFVSSEPLTVREMAKVTDWDEDAVTVALSELSERYNDRESGLQVIEIAEGWQMATRPEFAPVIGKLLAPHANRLSKPALETVTIVAYQQPCTQAEVEAVRGVSCDGVLKTLLERELIAEAGRKQTPGRPILYMTTPQFLHYFGLGSLDDLPVLEEDEEEQVAREDEARVALHAAGVDTDEI